MDLENHLEKSDRKNSQKQSEIAACEHIAGRLQENSRNSFVDLQSQKKTRQTKNSSFH